MSRVGAGPGVLPQRPLGSTLVRVTELGFGGAAIGNLYPPLLERCRARGVSVVAAAPYNSGLLATAHPAADAHFDYAEVSPAVLQQARDLVDRCAAAGVELPAAALKFPLRHPAVASVVVGLRTTAQVTQGLERLESRIGEETWTALDG